MEEILNVPGILKTVDELVVGTLVGANVRLEVGTLVGATEELGVVTVTGLILLMQVLLVCPPYAPLQQANWVAYTGRPLGMGWVLIHFPSGQGRL